MFSTQVRMVSALVAIIYSCSHVSLAKQCEKWEAKDYRDCTCGIQYKDNETNCENSNTYLDPVLDQSDLICPFKCENDGDLYVLGENHYYCNCKPGFAGVCCEMETMYCGGVLLAPQGRIESYSPYFNDLRCVWKISTDPEKRIALGVDSNFPFDVEAGSSLNACDNDYITVYDGPDKKAKQIGPFCGTARSFPTIHSTGRHLYVEFQTNNQTTANGFKLNYTTYREGHRCGPRKEYHLPTAVVSSPQFPLSFSPNENCEYEIFIKENYEVTLTTMVMNLMSSADCSTGDVIEVFKSNSTNEYELVTKLCGVGNYSPFTVRNADSVLLSFSSGYATDGKFKLRYQQTPSDDYFSQ